MQTALFVGKSCMKAVGKVCLAGPSPAVCNTEGTSPPPPRTPPPGRGGTKYPLQKNYSSIGVLWASMYSRIVIEEPNGRFCSFYGGPSKFAVSRPGIMFHGHCW